MPTEDTPPPEDTPTPGSDLVVDPAAFEPAYAGRADSLRTLQGSTELVADAIRHGVAGAQHIFPIGDVGLAQLVPHGYDLRVLDCREYEHDDRLPGYVRHAAAFVTTRSLVEYISRHVDPDASVAYLVDPYGRGLAMLTTETNVLEIVLDDHPRVVVDDDPSRIRTRPLPGRRAHVASLRLRPTEAARRWGRAMSVQLSQDAFLDLVVDAAPDIVAPDAAELRTLVSDLHAIRSVSIDSVRRTGSTGQIQLTENVELSAGSSTRVEFPEWLTIRFAPFAGIPTKPLELRVRVVPVVAQDHVAFALSCTTLDDQIAGIIADVEADFVERSQMVPLWRAPN